MRTNNKKSKPNKSKNRMTNTNGEERFDALSDHCRRSHLLNSGRKLFKDSLIKNMNLAVNVKVLQALNKGVPNGEEVSFHRKSINEWVRILSSDAAAADEDEWVRMLSSNNVQDTVVQDAVPEEKRVIIAKLMKEYLASDTSMKDAIIQLESIEDPEVQGLVSAILKTVDSITACLEAAAISKLSGETIEIDCFLTEVKDLMEEFRRLGNRLMSVQLQWSIINEIELAHQIHADELEPKVNGF